MEVDRTVGINIFEFLTMGPSCFNRRRRRTLHRWTARAKDLESKEEELRRSVHPDVLISLRSKRILLFGEMLREAGFPNADKLVFAMGIRQSDGTG